MQANSYKYMGTNLGCGKIFQHEAWQQANSRQIAQGHQPIKLLPSHEWIRGAPKELGDQEHLRITTNRIKWTHITPRKQHQEDRLDMQNIRKTPLRGLMVHKEKINVAWRASRRWTTRENTSRHDQDEKIWGGKDWHTKKKINITKKTCELERGSNMWTEKRIGVVGRTH